MGLFEKIVLFAVFFLVAILVIALRPGSAHEDRQPKRFVSLSATGTVKTTPDKVEISTGVTSQGETAKEALERNTQAMTEVVAALKEEGLDPKDIQTSEFTVMPLREAYKEGVSPKIIGYQVTNAVNITLRDPKKLGAILDRVVSVGANEINSISFGVSEPEALKDEARKLAMKEAIANAELYAEAAGVKLGKVLTISEDQAIMPPRPYARAAMEMKADAAAPIEAGTALVEVRISVTFGLE
jgi:hypothetical protein